MIKVLNYTKNPLTTIGEIAGICYNTTNPDRYKNIAKRCLKEGHDRVSEFADIVIEIDGYSAKMGRELYTAMIGVSKLQSSTRYIDYTKQFDYIIPKTIKENTEEYKIWQETMVSISKGMSKLKELGIPTEDYTNLLPLAYQTKMVLKINLRAIIHMFHIRSCTCAYWEYRNFMNDLKEMLSNLDDEWKYLSDEYFVPKCIASGYCNETTRHCGIRPLKSEVVK